MDYFVLRKRNCLEVGKALQGVEKKGRAAELVRSSGQPLCACEGRRLSKYSPRPVMDDEMLARFAFHPTHFSKKGELRASIFSHFFDRGCSIQRESVARPGELQSFCRSMLSGQVDWVWGGVVTARCSEVRRLFAEKEAGRVLCVYDTANKDNPAHGEIFRSRDLVEEGDENEIRAELMRIFNCKSPISPNEYQGGLIWGSLPAELRRTMPAIDRRQ